MRLRSLFLAASFLLPAACAQADNFTTTITGGGNVFVFPNVGGPTNYTYYSRVDQIYAGPLAVTVNGGAPTLGSLYFYLDSNPSQPAVSVTISNPGQSPTIFPLYGPDLIGYLAGTGFYSFPGTYNLADTSGNPYTYVVTDNTLSAVPEPPGLAMCATAAICLMVFYRRSALLSFGRFPE